MPMKINQAITDLKKSLESVYSNLRERTDIKAWKNLIDPAFAIDPVQTSILVVDFLQLHRYMPSACVRAIVESIDLTNHPADMADVFSADIINRILDDMSSGDVVSYDHISSEYTDNQVKDIVNIAGEVRTRIDHLQLYMADRTLNKLKKYCPTHPDVLELQKEVAGLKNNMIGYLRDIVRRDDDNAVAAAEKQVSSDKETALVTGGKIHDAVEYYENLLAANPDRKYAYYRVGKLYLETGETDKADYMASLIFDRTDNKAEAYTLKGLVLAKKEQYEDALFYFSSAYRKNPSFTDAEKGRISMINKLDGEASLRFFEESDAREMPEEKVISIKSSPKYIRDIDPMLDEIDDMLRRGRMSEAYYEIRHNSSNHKEYEILTFIKGFTLYMMKRYKEARDIFKEISRSAVFGDYAVWMAEDIDHKIVDTNLFDGLSPSEIAAVYFDAGRLDKALEVIMKIPRNSVTAEVSAMRGRCEINAGDMDAAFDAFERALRLNPEMHGIREMLGMISQARGKEDLALQYYNEAIEKDDAPAGASIMKASILFDHERNEELLEYRNNISEKLPGGSDVDGYAGFVMTEKYPRNIERGAAYLERAIAAGSRKTEFYVALINLFINNEMYHTALQFTEDGFFNVTSAKELFMKKAEILFMLEKYTPAELITGMLLATHPDSPELQYIRGMIYSERGNDREAIKWLRSAAAGDPTIHKFASAVADKYYDIGEFNNALEFYTKAVDLDETDSISLKRRAVIYKAQGNYETAIIDIEKAMALSPDDAEIYLIIGDILKDYNPDKLPEELRAKVDTAAIDRKIKSASKSESGEGETEAVSGESADGNGSDTPEANDINNIPEEGGSSEEEEDATVSEPQAEPEVPADEDAEAGAVVEEELPETETEDFFEKAFEAAGKEDAEPAGFEQSKLLQDMDRDSEFYFTKALELDPQYRQAYMTRARYYAENGEKKLALADIDRAIDLDPDEMDGYMVRGVICHILGMDEDAIRDFKRVAKNDFMVTQAYSYISNCLNTLGRFEESVQSAEVGLTIDNDYLNLYLNRGIAYYGMKDYEKAIDDFRRIISKRNEIEMNTVAAAYRFRGLCFEKTGDDESAMHDYRLLLKYDSEQSEIRARLEALERKAEEAAKPKRRFSFFHRKK